MSHVIQQGINQLTTSLAADYKSAAFPLDSLELQIQRYRNCKPALLHGTVAHSTFNYTVHTVGERRLPLTFHALQ